MLRVAGEALRSASTADGNDGDVLLGDLAAERGRSVSLVVTAEANGAKSGESGRSAEFVDLTVGGEMRAGTICGTVGQSS